MLKLGGIAAVGGVSLAALALVLTPAIAASTQQGKSKRPRAVSLLRAGSFTPAMADPRLAAEFARRGFTSGPIRFTPSAATGDKNKSVRVAVRARSATTAAAVGAVREASASPITAITPAAYNLGASIGWKRFAISGDVVKVQGGVIGGSREAAEVGVSYSGKKFTGRVQVGAERGESVQPRIVPIESSYSLDVGGSYKVARNLDVTGGVRYKVQRDRLEPLAQDSRRDSQAVYVGTAFRF